MVNEVEVFPKPEIKNLMEMDTRDIVDAPKVITMLFDGKTHEEIASALGMERANVTYKIHRLMDTREFQNALTDEWIKRYNEMRGSEPKTAFKALTRLVAQTITRHFESSHDVTLTERKELVIVSTRNYEEEIRGEVERTLQSHRTGEQVAPQQTPSKTGQVPPAQLP